MWFSRRNSGEQGSLGFFFATFGKFLQKAYNAYTIYTSFNFRRKFKFVAAKGWLIVKEKRGGEDNSLVGFALLWCLDTRFSC